MALTKVQTIGIETGISLTGVTTVTTLNASTDTLSVGGTVNFGGNVSIAGTLTYEDVTNIDSVGIITARNGIKVNDLGVQVGTGATVDSAADNVLTFLTGGSERVRVSSGGDMGLGTASPTARLDVRRDDADGLIAEFHQSSGYGINIKSSQTVATIQAEANQALTFETGSSATERLRIDSSGRLLLGTTTEGEAGADDLTIATSSSGGITIRTGTSSSGNLYFSDGTSGADEYRGYVQYNHSSDFLALGTNASERMRITSGGFIGVNRTSPGRAIDVLYDDATAYSETAMAPSLGAIRVFNNSTTTNSTAGEFVFGTGDSGTAYATISAIRVGSQETELAFRTSDSATLNEAFRIDKSGRLLAGTTANSGNFRAVFQGNAGNNSAGGDLLLARGAETPANAQALGLLGFSDNTHTISAQIQCNRDGGTWSGSSKPTLMAFQTCADSSSTPTERMRITKDGYLRFGQSSADTPGYGNSTTGISMLPDGRIFSSMGGTFSQFNRNSNGTVVSFARSSTGVGQISVTTSATTYGTSSDYRLKENVVALDGAIARVKQLLPKRFNFIVDNTKTVDGFIAHEAQTVVPEAVTGTHNEVDDDGNAVMQGIDTSKLVPLLTAALQEAIAKIETLETKVAALEG